MKSYYKFLETTKLQESTPSIARKPTFRSSAIFPVLHNRFFTTRLCFAGYWMLKRNIQEVTLLCTLRDQKGLMLLRHSCVIDTAKAFSIELSSLLTEAKAVYPEQGFQGSLELEVFSAKDLVFAYPAFVMCYYNENFSSSVHTVGRIYNDIEDWQENEEQLVRESGFDIYAREGFDPFIAFTNGPWPEKNASIEYTLITEDGQIYPGTAALGEIAPFETIFFKLKEHINLKSLLGNKRGTIKIKHAFKGFFPRMLAGNFEQSGRSVSVTHTYFDCSSSDKESDYWHHADEQYHDAAVMLPAFLDQTFYTDVVFYPMYSPSVFWVSFDFYGEAGELLARASNVKRVDTKKNVFEKISLKDIALKERLDLGKVRSMNFIINREKDSRFPTRLKMGLNVGMENRPIQLPCNICFAPILGNLYRGQKKRAFQWLPFLNLGKSVVVLTNGSSKKDYHEKAVVDVCFLREADNQVMKKTYEIEPFGSRRIDLTDESIKDFFRESTGWVVYQSENPFIYGWYFDFHDSGSVAGDHCF